MDSAVKGESASDRANREASLPVASRQLRRRLVGNFLGITIPVLCESSWSFRDWCVVVDTVAIAPETPHEPYVPGVRQGKSWRCPG